jgi:hypothetical protein
MSDIRNKGSADRGSVFVMHSSLPGPAGPAEDPGADAAEPTEAFVAQSVPVSTTEALPPATVTDAALMCSDLTDVGVRPLAT